MNQVLQSGQVTPQHLASWTTDGVIQDSGVTFNNTIARFRSDVLGINFNAANTDFPISINVPVGFTKFRISNIYISGASGTLATSTVGVFTQQNGAGIAIVTGATANPITTNLPNTVNNMVSLSINDAASLAYNITTIFFRVQTPQGVAATANVTVTYDPLP